MSNCIAVFDVGVFIVGERGVGVFRGILSTALEESGLTFFETCAKVTVEGVDLFAGSRKVVDEPLVASTPSIFSGEVEMP